MTSPLLRPLRCGDKRGSLTIEGVNLHNADGAWCLASDLTPLWVTFAKRVEDDIVPGVAGRDPNDSLGDETSHDLNLVVTGAVDPTVVNSGYTNPWARYEANLTYLREQIVDPVGLLDGVLAMPSGTTREADVRVRVFEPRDVSREAPIGLFRFTLEIPGVLFAEVGS